MNILRIIIILLPILLIMSKKIFRYEINIKKIYIPLVFLFISVIGTLCFCFIFNGYSKNPYTHLVVDIIIDILSSFVLYLFIKNEK